MNQTLNTRKIFQIAVVVFLLVALPVALLLSRQSQEIRKKATDNANLSIPTAATYTPSLGALDTYVMVPAGTKVGYAQGQLNYNTSYWQSAAVSVFGTDHLLFSSSTSTPGVASFSVGAKSAASSNVTFVKIILTPKTTASGSTTLTLSGTYTPINSSPSVTNLGGTISIGSSAAEPTNTITIGAVTPTVVNGENKFKATVTLTGNPAPLLSFGGETTTCAVKLIGAESTYTNNDDAIKNSFASPLAYCLGEGVTTYDFVFSPDEYGHSRKVFATFHNDSVGMASNRWANQAWSIPVSSAAVTVPAVGEPTNTITIGAVTPTVVNGENKFKATVTLTGNPAPLLSFGGETTTCAVKLIGAESTYTNNDDAIKNSFASPLAYCLGEGVTTYDFVFSPDEYGHSRKVFATFHNDSVGMASNRWANQAWSIPVSSAAVTVPAVGEPTNTITIGAVTPTVVNGENKFKATVTLTGNPAPLLSFGGETTTCAVKLIGAESTYTNNDDAIKNSFASPLAYCLGEGVTTYDFVFSPDEYGHSRKVFATFHNDSVGMASNRWANQAWSIPVSSAAVTVPAVGEPTNTITIGAVTPTVVNGENKFKATVTLTGNPAPLLSFGGETTTCAVKLIGAESTYTNNDDAIKNSFASPLAYCLGEGVTTYDFVFSPDEYGHSRKVFATFHNDSVGMASNRWANQAWSIPVSSAAVTVPAVNLPSNTLWDSLLGAPGATYNAAYDLWPTAKDNRVDGFDYVRWLDLGGQF